MFDFPTDTQSERKQATRFRNALLDQGFEMSQFSVYLKYCASAEKAESISQQVKLYLPSGGKVDILTITDRQFANMQRFYAKTPQKNEKTPNQLHLF